MKARQGLYIFNGRSIKKAWLEVCLIIFKSIYAGASRALILAFVSSDEIELSFEEKKTSMQEASALA